MRQNMFKNPFSPSGIISHIMFVFSLNSRQVKHLENEVMIKLEINIWMVNDSLKTRPNQNSTPSNSTPTNKTAPFTWISLLNSHIIENSIIQQAKKSVILISKTQPNYDWNEWNGIQIWPQVAKRNCKLAKIKLIRGFLMAEIIIKKFDLILPDIL